LMMASADCTESERGTAEFVALLVMSYLFCN